METTPVDTPCKHKNLRLLDEISIGSMSEDEFVDAEDGRGWVLVECKAV